VLYLSSSAEGACAGAHHSIRLAFREMKNQMTKISDGVGPFDVAPQRPRIRPGVVVVLLALIVLPLAWIERPLILGAMARSWILSDRLEPADAAAVLGGGTDTRPRAAARLYASGLIKQIIVFNTADQTEAASASDADRRTLLKFGIPARAITELDENPANTYEEARALLRWAEQNRAQRIIVPTEIFPSRRVQWILRRELGKAGVRVMVEVIALSEYDADDWWQHRTGLADFQSEAIKYLYYRVRY
jgi:uncharacterized SAM-binding protein YcdF (DUF218 family)